MPCRSRASPCDVPDERLPDDEGSPERACRVAQRHRRARSSVRRSMGNPRRPGDVHQDVQGDGACRRCSSLGGCARARLSGGAAAICGCDGARGEAAPHTRRAWQPGSAGAGRVVSLGGVAPQPSSGTPAPRRSSRACRSPRRRARRLVVRALRPTRRPRQRRRPRPLPRNLGLVKLTSEPSRLGEALSPRVDGAKSVQRGRAPILAVLIASTAPAQHTGSQSVRKQQQCGTCQARVVQRLSKLGGDP